MILKPSTLGEIYELIGSLDSSIALFDFTCGELGYEVLMAQSVGREFYLEHRDTHKVVALCWKGCSVLAENISDIQVELDNTDVSIIGNKKHRGNPRYNWLEEMGHWESIEMLPNVKERFGPVYWGGDRRGIAGRSEMKVSCDKIREIATRNVVEYGKVIRPLAPIVIDGNYTVLFDRNEKHQRKRNTRLEHIEHFYKESKDKGESLVILSGLYPREDLPGDVIRFQPRHRDIDLLCSLIRHCSLFVCPDSGMGEAGLVLGTNMVLISVLNELNKKRWDLMSSMATARGFTFSIAR